jgi:hypothetical protein
VEAQQGQQQGSHPRQLPANILAMLASMPNGEMLLAGLQVRCTTPQKAGVAPGEPAA